MQQPFSVYICSGKRGRVSPLFINGMEALERRIHEIIAEADGIFLVELKISETSRDVKLFVDKIPGITIQDCAKLSRKIINELEADYDFSTRYNLEVSSPGADQPFKVPQQFHQYLNRPVEVKTTDGKKVIGLLTTVNDSFITVVAEDKKKKKQTAEPAEIPLALVAYTKPHLKF